MFLTDIDITNDSLITEIVVKDFRTSGVFRKHGIDYCCGGKMPLQTVCEMKGLDTDLIKEELYEAVRTVQLSNSTNYNKWSIDFLVDYIVNVHHSYLVNNFPDILDTLTRFVESHKSKNPLLVDLQNALIELRDEILPHLEQEEKIIFPYIKQVTHAYENKESYAALLVRTLRKPVENIMNHEHRKIAQHLHRLRELTRNYTPPSNACLSHRVSFAKLKELDNDLVQHIHLESNILFPKAVAMEREMLALK